MKCPYCSKEIQENDFACPYCGKALASPETLEKVSIANDEEAIRSVNDIHDATQKSWALPFIGYGALAGLPIPCVGWLWLILSINSAIRLGWAKGLMGIGLFFGTAFAARVIFTFLLSGFSGN